MDEHLMLDPMRRRNWLFAKALETAPLNEALAFAEAAEAFITGTMEQSLEVTSASPFEMPPKTDKPQQKSVPTFTARDNQPLGTTGVLTGLTSLVSIEDVVLYLRQGGGVAPAKTESADELLARANGNRAGQGLPPFTLFLASPSETAEQGKAVRAKNVTAPRLSAAPRPPCARESGVGAAGYCYKRDAPRAHVRVVGCRPRTGRRCPDNSHSRRPPHLSSGARSARSEPGRQEAALVPASA
jgi:hypothetical protein